MMARVVIRKPEIPCFVLNSQVRVADWEQVCGTHQGQRQMTKPRSKAGHRTVLTNRVINAFYPCNADAIHTGQSRLLQARLLLAQHFFVSATASILRCSVFRQRRHREGQNQVSPEKRLSGRRSNNQVAKFAVITALNAKGRPDVPAELTSSEMVICSFFRHKPAALYRSCRDYLKPNTPKH